MHYLKFHYRYFFMFLILSVILFIFIYNIYIYKSDYITDFKSRNSKVKLNITFAVKKEKKNSLSILCNIFSCFNVYQCGHKGSRLSVYVYASNLTSSDEKLKKNHLTQEFNLILQAIVSSKYYVSNPNEACILVPSFDMLNSDKKNTPVIDFLNKLQQQRKGRNHLLFQYIFEPTNNVQKSEIDERLNQAMIAGVGFTKYTFRRNFDISLPVFSSLLYDIKNDARKTRKYFVISSQANTNPDIHKDLLNLQQMYPNELYIFDTCLGLNSTNKFLRCTNNQVHTYTDVLQQMTEKTTLAIALKDVKEETLVTKVEGILLSL
ncbi:exostosin-2-like isoform X2 [Nasonia vitripennis]|uniref:Exostosin GT47 domain-containing protein n=1 Tax=Nasonia vitripennis TaxID=7425 RepID=A0A7M7QKQ6_NASVI|nr:exostosin-2-like isoform X2 [Nasonia vitripennis]